MTLFKIKQSEHNERWTYTLTDDGEELMTSKGRESKNRLLEDIRSVRAYSHNPSRYQLFETVSGKYGFRLVDDSGLVCGKSPIFDTEGQRARCVFRATFASQSAVVVRVKQGK